MSKMYRVEMFVPCVEAFVYEIEANSEEDALNLVITSNPDPVEYYTTEHNEDKAEIYIDEIGGA